MNTEEIKKIIPHRYPFLLIDKVVSVEPGKNAYGVKNITINEPFFQGHFPDLPIMPGVLIVEALAQLGAVSLLIMEENKGKIVLFAGIDKFRFKKPVYPGDRLDLNVQITKMRGVIGKGKAEAKVDGEIVASGELVFVVQNR